MENYYLEDKKANRLTIHFPSACDLLEYKNDFTVNLDVWNDHFKSKRGYSGGKKWLGPTATSSPEVVQGAMLGDHVLYEKHLKPKLNELKKALGYGTRDYKQRIKKVKRRVLFNGYGDELDIHKVYQGQLDKAWRRTERVTASEETKLITLFVQIAGISNEDATKSLWRAAVAVLLVEDLISAGKSVKVVVGGSSSGVTKKGHRMTVSITVKEYNEKLSLERLAAMCHLGFYRTFGFAAKSCQPYKLEGGLGSSYNMQNKDMPIQFHDDIHKGHAKFVVLNRCLNLGGAVDSVKSAMKQMKEFADAA